MFVDLGGVDGLVHITDLSWGRINHPEELVSLDEKINVVILDFDDEKNVLPLASNNFNLILGILLTTILRLARKSKEKLLFLLTTEHLLKFQQV